MEDDRSLPVPGPLIGGPAPAAARSKRSASRSRRIFQRIAAPLVLAVLRILWLSYRFRISGLEVFEWAAAEDRPVIIACWHGDLVLVSYLVRRLDRMGLRPTFVISPSRDGDFAMRVVDLIGGRAVRGSATRSGVKALKGLYRAMTRDGGSPVVPTDGPSGPAQECKEGVILLSRLAQNEVVAVGVAARPAWRLKSWDRLLLPPPLARVSIEIGRPFIVPRDLETEGIERRRAELERDLLDLGERAHARLGAKG